MADERRRDPERELLGNGALTVAARLASVVGVPLLCWLFLQLWGDVKKLHEDKVQLASTLAAIGAKLEEAQRWNTTQDQRIDRVIERLQLQTREQQERDRRSAPLGTNP